jgi:hypothetical protein
MTLEETADTNSFQDWTRSVRTFERSLRVPHDKPEPINVVVYPPPAPTIVNVEDEAAAPEQSIGDVEIFMSEDVAQAVRIFTESKGNRQERMRLVLMFALQVAAINLSVK